MQALGGSGSVDFQEISREVIWANMPLSASVVSPMSGISPRDSSSGRGGKRSMIVGPSFSDFVFKRLWQNPDHYPRILTLFRNNNSVMCSSLMKCSLLALVPSSPTVLFRHL